MASIFSVKKTTNTIMAFTFQWYFFINATYCYMVYEPVCEKFNHWRSNILTNNKCLVLLDNGVNLPVVTCITIAVLLVIGIGLLVILCDCYLRRRCCFRNRGVGNLMILIRNNINSVKSMRITLIGGELLQDYSILILILLNCEKKVQAPLVWGCLKYQTYLYDCIYLHSYLHHIT